MGKVLTCQTNSYNKRHFALISNQSKRRRKQLMLLYSKNERLIQLLTKRGFKQLSEEGEYQIFEFSKEILNWTDFKKGQDYYLSRKLRF